MYLVKSLKPFISKQQNYKNKKTLKQIEFVREAIQASIAVCQENDLQKFEALSKKPSLGHVILF